MTRCTEHQQDNMKGNWKLPGATEHTKERHGQLKWIHLRTITIMSNMYVKKEVCMSRIVKKERCVKPLR